MSPGEDKQGTKEQNETLKAIDRLIYQSWDPKYRAVEKYWTGFEPALIEFAFNRKKNRMNFYIEFMKKSIHGMNFKTFEDISLTQYKIYSLSNLYMANEEGLKGLVKAFQLDLVGKKKQLSGVG